MQKQTNQEQNQDTSFRGMPIPEVQPENNYQVADSKKVIDKIMSMSPEERKNVTLDSIHYQDKEISIVKLSTGDVVPVEAAIALAENKMLNGFRAGRNAKGDRTLRATPNFRSNEKNSIHKLPVF